MNNDKIIILPVYLSDDFVVWLDKKLEFLNLDVTE